MVGVDFVGQAQAMEAQALHDGKRVFKVSATERGVFKGCKRKWYFSSLSHMGLEAVQTPRALWYGTGIHYALEQYYCAQQIHGVQAAPDFDILAAWERWVEAEASAAGADQQARLEEDAALGREMLKGYQTFTLEADRGFAKILGVEAEYAVPILETETEFFELVGRFDLVVEDTEGSAWVVDHKTAKSLIDPAALALNDQMSVYHMAAQSFFGGRAAGCLYNVLRKKAPQTPKLLANGTLSQAWIDTTVEKYAETLHAHGLNEEEYSGILEKIASAGTPFFQRCTVQHTGKQLENIRKMLVAEIQDMTQTQVFYPNKQNTCVHLCEFAPLCIALENGDDIDFVISQKYRKRDVQEGSVYERV